MDDTAAETSGDESPTYTRLITAAILGRNNDVRTLIADGANVDEPRSSLDGTALNVACCFGNFDVVVTLLAANADVHHRDQKGQTPLHCAIRESRADIVVKLLEANADVNQPDSGGSMPLHIACSKAMFLRNTNVVATLLTWNANVNQADENGCSPLKIACIHGYLDLVQVLCSHGAQRSFRGGRTAETIATRPPASAHPAAVPSLTQPRGERPPPSAPPRAPPPPSP